MTSTVPNVAQYLLAGKPPDQTALTLLQSSHSYHALATQAGLVASHLLRLGALKGDRILLIADNSLFWAACYLGTMQAGLISVPVAPSVPAQDLAYLLETTDAKVVCAQASVIKAHADGLAHQHLLTDREVPSIAQAYSQRSLPSLAADTTALN